MQRDWQPIRLSGRVTTERGGDLSGCDVAVFAAHKERWEWPSSRFLGSVRAQRVDLTNGGSQTIELPCFVK